MAELEPYDINDVKTKRNKTKREEIETSPIRSMVQ